MVDNSPKKRKYRKPQSGYKLRDVMDQKTLDKLYAYKRRLKRDKLEKSNNKGDQYYGRRTRADGSKTHYQR